MQLVPAEGALLEQIIDLTYPIWNEGLTRDGYARWNAAQMRTPWGAAHLHRLALVDDSGALLATAKRYRWDARIDRRDGWVCGIGAVFTPPAQRGHDYAARLLERLLDEERAAGALGAVLFSEIGAAFYERLGFRGIPLDEVTVKVTRKGGAPAVLVRSGEDRDLPALAALHETRTAGVRFALRRSEAMIAYALAKKRMLAGLGPPGLRRVEFFVAEEGASAVAYVLLSVNDNGWTLEEAGDRDPAGARVGAILQVLVEREPSHATPLIRTWWPRSFPVPPQLALTDRTNPRDRMMVRPLADLAMPSSPIDVFYWHSDYF